MNATAKKEVVSTLHIKLSQQEADLLRAAASADNRCVTHFILNAAVNAATETLYKRELLDAFISNQQSS